MSEFVWQHRVVRRGRLYWDCYAKHNHRWEFTAALCLRLRTWVRARLTAWEGK